MKFQYFGTAAAEGWPALFCTCDNCRRAAKAGGRNLRTRSQAAVDDKLLIDFPADTLAHMYYSGLDLPRIRDCIITHSHSDHLYPADLEMRLDGFAYPGDDRPLVFYATKEAAPGILEMLEKCGLIKQNRVLFQEIRPFEPFEAAGYTVTPLPANHDPASGPVFFLIEDGEKSLLYANDTGWFPEETWEWLEKHGPHLDFVSLDCTGGLRTGWRNGHMGLDTAMEALTRLRHMGLADDATAACLHHFSHTGGATYDELVPIAAEQGLLVAYDGMTVAI